MIVDAAAIEAAAQVIAQNIHVVTKIADRCKTYYTGQVTPDIKLVTYKIDLKRVINRKLVMGVGDGIVIADGRPIYEANDLRVGLFTSTDF